MNQIELIEAAKQQAGLTSDYKLAQALSISRSRVSEMKKGTLPADEYEIFMLAEMARIDPKQAAAAVRMGRERNPAKKAYWEKISAGFEALLSLVRPRQYCI